MGVHCMKITANTLINSYHSNSLPKKDTPNNHKYKKFELDVVSDSKNRQSINLNKDKTYDLGTLNGKPFHIKLLPESGFEWSGRIRLSGRPEGKVTPEQIAAANAFDSYNSYEWLQGEHMGAVIATITRIADNNLETTYFNKLVKLHSITQSEIENALQRLGVDPHKPFSINGRTFAINSGLLEDYTDENIIKD